MKIKITSEGESHETTWDEFAASNADDCDMLKAAQSALMSSGSYIGGGGAAPLFGVEVI